MKVLDPLLEPETVAVIGASRNPLKVGGSVMANLRAASGITEDVIEAETARTIGLAAA